MNKRQMRRTTWMLWIVGIAFQPIILRANDSTEAFSGYDKAVKPFLQTYCMRCHGPETTEGDMRLDSLSPFFSDESFARTIHLRLCLCRFLDVDQGK